MNVESQSESEHSQSRRIELMLERIAALEEQVKELQKPVVQSPASAPPGDDSRWTRRALLLGGAGGVVGAAATVVGATPAAAAKGDVAILGQLNHSGLFRTTFESTSAHATIEAVTKVSLAHAIYATSVDSAAISGFAETLGGVGVEGVCGWPGDAVRGTGVRGSCFSGWGVVGESQAGVGTEGRSTAGTGARGLSAGGIGVEGVSTVGPAVVARSESGPALMLATIGLDGPPADTNGATWERGSVIMTTKGELWLCVATGVPGTWRLLMSPGMSGAYVPITPTRVYDSRYIRSDRTATPSPIPAGGSRLISVAQGYKVNSDTPIPLSGVPAGVRAVAVNVTVTNTSSKGWLSLQPGNATSAGTSSINWVAGQTIANGLMLTLDDKRQFNAFANGSSVDVIIDITGYFRAT